MDDKLLPATPTPLSDNSESLMAMPENKEVTSIRANKRNDYPGNRTQRSRVFLGLTIQYNLFNRYYKATYVDRLNSRIGFEYILKSKPKSK